MKRARLCIPNLAILFLWCSVATAADSRVRPVILSDWPAPVGVFDHGNYGPIRFTAGITTQYSGALIRDFSLNESGQIAFSTRRTPSSDQAAVWLWENGSIVLIGSTSVATPWGVTYQRFNGGLAFNNFGEVIVSGTLNETNGRRVVESFAGGFQIAEGDTAPGTELGTVFAPGPTYTAHNEFPSPFVDLVLNDLGEVAFGGKLDGPSVEVNNDESLWSTRGGTLSLVAREGQSIAQFGSQAVIGESQDVPPGWIGPDPPFPAYPGGGPIATLNNSGDILFNVPILNGSVDSATMRSISSSTTALEPFVYDGAFATNLEEFTTVATFSEFSLSNAGLFVFQAGFRRGSAEPTRGLWVHDGSNFQLVAEIGEVAPGVDDDTRYLFFDSFNVAPNIDGQFAFGAALGDALGNLANNRDGIWYWTGTDVDLVVREGQPAPGFSSEVFRSINNVPLPINDAGQFFFMAKVGLPGSSPPATPDSIWMSDAEGNLRLIVIEGSEIEIGPGDVRIVSELDNNFSPHHRNQSQFVFWARFTDGTEGLFTVPIVPEPSGIVLMTIAIAFYSLRRRSAVH